MENKRLLKILLGINQIRESRSKMIKIKGKRYARPFYVPQITPCTSIARWSNENGLIYELM